MNPGSEISFDNTEFAFEYKSEKELRKANFLFSSMSHSWLVNLGVTITPWAIKAGLPVNGIIRDTIFAQFVGGETLLGGELKQVFETQLKTAFVSDYAATGEGSFGQSDGEAIYLDPLDSTAVESSRAIVTAGAAAGSLKAYSLAKELKGKVDVVHFWAFG